MTTPRVYFPLSTLSVDLIQTKAQLEEHICKSGLISLSCGREGGPRSSTSCLTGSLKSNKAVFSFVRPSLQKQSVAAAEAPRLWEGGRVPGQALLRVHHHHSQSEGHLNQFNRVLGPPCWSGGGHSLHSGLMKAFLRLQHRDLGVRFAFIPPPSTASKISPRCAKMTS